jgi:hypothetical protein
MTGRTQGNGVDKDGGTNTKKCLCVSFLSGDSPRPLRRRRDDWRVVALAGFSVLVGFLLAFRDATTS